MQEVLKLTGLGNDFLVCAERPSSRSDWDVLARKWCNPASGPGADGLLLLERLGETALSMTLYNADGSQAEVKR